MLAQPSRQPLIHIIRHGQSLHNIQKRYPYRDPPLTEVGEAAAKSIKLPSTPDLIIISPMARAIQTAMAAFPDLIGTENLRVEVQIWPELREAHDAICNKGVPRSEIMQKFPQFDFSKCPEEWDHAPHTAESARARAELVRKRLQRLSEKYDNIVIVSHRGFLAFLVQGERFDLCESRSYQFAKSEKEQSWRMGVNVDSQEPQDFGPTVLIPHQAKETGFSKNSAGGFNE